MVKSSKKTVKGSKKSPLKAKPLRNPGESLQQEINQTYDSTYMESLFMAIVLTSITLVSWIQFFVKAPPLVNAIVYSCITIILLPIFIRRMYLARQNINRLKMARDGEQAVAEYLDLLKNEHCFVIHDIVGEDFNIDHIVICSQGVFTIETKTLSKIEGKNSKIYFDGEKIKINSYEPPRNPIIQVKAQRNWLINLLKEGTGKSFYVKPVVTFPGWFVKPMAKPKDDIWVIEPKQLKALIDQESEKLSQTEIHMISAYLKRFIRSAL